MFKRQVSLLLLALTAATTTIQVSFAEQCICKVRATALFRHDDNNDDGDLEHHSWHQFDCVTGNGATCASYSSIALDVDMDHDDFYVRNEASFRAGRFFLEFDSDLVNEYGQLPREYYNGNGVKVLADKEVEALYNTPAVADIAPPDAAATPRLRGNNMNDVQQEEKSKAASLFVHDHHNNHSRRRLSNIGKQACGLVIVHTPGAQNPVTVSDAEAMVYTHASNQFRDCSAGAMELVKADNTVHITLPKNIGQYTSNSIDSDMFAAICQHYGYPSNCEITKKRDLDHILFSLPYGLSDDKPGTFWAKGSAGDSRRFSSYGGGELIAEGIVFKGGFLIPSTIMHE